MGKDLKTHSCSIPSSVIIERDKDTIKVIVPFVKFRRLPTTSSRSLYILCLDFPKAKFQDEKIIFFN